MHSSKLTCEYSCEVNIKWLAAYADVKFLISIPIIDKLLVELMDYLRMLTLNCSWLMKKKLFFAGKPQSSLS